MYMHVTDLQQPLNNCTNQFDTPHHAKSMAYNRVVCMMAASEVPVKFGEGSDRSRGSGA